MKEITLLYAYYENPQMLTAQLREWLMWEPVHNLRTKFIIVDDGSQKYPAMPIILSAMSIQQLDLQVFRVLEDRPWGQDAARNIGMAYTKTDWVLMTDMDHMVTFGEIGELIRFEPNRKTYYMPRRVTTGGMSRHPHPNSFIMHKHDFWRMGGYDEDFVGYYGSDGNFRKCAKGSGLIEWEMEGFRLVEYTRDEIEDANTVKYSRKEGPLYAAANPALNAKRMGPAYRASNPLRTPYERLL